ncbi:MAG: flagellar biosynthesis protein FlhA [Alphaproteobacteria bacterium RIFCSPHIGHO2_12_FULL_63_12]|nr:MAG: flagellar biosynthesis protein FlhA [Alphaproteobacteria bacterium RIFCSPHIGHO2_12_FULL_63_12]
MSETVLKSFSLPSPSAIRSLARSDVLLAAAILSMLALLVLPVPRFLLDLLLALSITLSVTVLMTALFTKKALEFSTFPAILLISTIFRLGLNVASTRLILADGHQGPDAAGRVIEAFGGFVMQGNFVIGIIVFAILVIVNFVVITRGSGRIAEVAARFSLDAMPGKQMAIDADLSSGLINESEAKARRKQLEDESNFYGAMDGASKYVRGDAIAGLLITLVNILGGIFIGVLQNGLTLGAATESYTLLTVGDGLVSQIPALIVSVAAGLLVSKAGVDGSADKALGAQFGANPTALAIVAAVLAIFAVLPGMPFIPFMLLAVGVGYVALTLTRRKKARADSDTKKAQSSVRQKSEDDPASMLAMDDLRIELGYGLLPLIADGSGPKLTDQIKALRRAIAQDIGFVAPPVRILDNMQLGPNDYVIRLKEQEAGRGSVRPGQFLIMDPGGKRLDFVGEITKEPAFGLDAMWIDESQRQSATLRGLTVVDASTVLTTHLTEIIRAEAPALLSYAETKKLLDTLSDKHRQLVTDIVPSVVTISTIQRVLQALIAERVSIRDLPSILEAIAEAAPGNPGVTPIAEHVRARLARQICGALKGADGAAPIVTLSLDWERAFAENLIGAGEDRQLAMAPSKIQEFVAAVLRKLEDAAASGHAAALVTSAGVRPFVRSVIERVRPQTIILSQNEIHPQIRLRNLGSV